MGRRRQASNVEFGADSFLDIITNMVGIMIILIVIAGMKISRAPVVLNQLFAAQSQQESIETAPETGGPSVKVAAIAAPPAEPAPEKPAAKKPAMPQVIEPAPELKQYAHRLETELARYEVEQLRVREELKKAAEKERELEEQRNKVIRLLAVESSRLEKSKQEFGRIRGTLDETQAMLSNLKQSIEEVEHDKPPVKQIRHQLNPVSRVIEEKELHFRLMGNRIVHVPIDDLIERLRPQIEDHKKQLIRRGGYRGKVGPVGGFLMGYVVEAQTLSAVDEIRHGGSMVRINIAQWEIIPEPDVLTESADEALRNGSRFLQVVRGAMPGTTLTFWVYPDSFELYRRLTQFAHDENFTVAARPLPNGVPIAGSPNGSRSAGQ